jgi:hypothetical protein
MVKNNNIEVSSNGIKFSYRRFLADTSIGFIFLLYILEKYPHLIKNEFIIVFFVLASTPLGLLINNCSWVLLSFFQSYFSQNFIELISKNKLCFIGKYLLYGTDKFYKMQDLIKFFNIKDRNIYTIMISDIEHFLSIYFFDRITYYQDLVGMRILARNVAFILFIFSITIIIDEYKCFLGVMFFWLGVFFLIVNSIMTLYGHFYLLTVFKCLFVKKCEFDINYDKVKEIIEREIKKINTQERKENKTICS